MSDLPKEIYAGEYNDETVEGGWGYIEGDYYNTLYIRKDEHERLISVCESYHEKKIAEKNAEIEQLKNHIEELNIEIREIQ